VFTIYILSQTFFFFSELKLKLTWSYHNVIQTAEGSRTAPWRGTPAATASVRSEQADRERAMHRGRHKPVVWLPLCFQHSV